MSSLGLCFAGIARAEQPPELPDEPPDEDQAPPPAPEQTPPGPQPSPSAEPGGPDEPQPAPADQPTAPAQPDEEPTAGTEAETSATGQMEGSTGSTAGTATTEAAAVADDTDGEEDDGVASGPGIVRGRHEPVMNTLRGGVGLFYTTLPDVGGAYSFRFRLHTDFFRSSIIGDDENSRVRGSINLGFTPWKYLEAFFAIHSQANRNERDDPARQDPVTQFALGDLGFGVKGGYQWDQYGIGLGGQLGLGLLSGTQRLLTDDVNFWFDALFSVDLRYLTAKQIPVRFSTNVGWILDRSLNLVDWEGITDRDSREVTRFALGANHNRVRMRYAVDFPVRLGDENQFGIDPILEWSWDVSTEEDDRFFVEGWDAPLDRAMSWLTIGARGNVWHGLHLDAAVDVALFSPNFEFGPPVPQWQVILGLGWYVDTRPQIREVEVEPEETAPPPPEPTLDGRLVGRVVGPDGTPVADAKVTFPGLTSTAVVTDGSGNFTSFRFPSGTVDVAVEIDDQIVAETAAEVSEGEDTPLTITLEQTAATDTGMVKGSFTGTGGEPVKVSMHVQGQGVDESFESTPDGLILLELFAGEYQATLSASGHEDKTIDFTVPTDGEIQLQETLEPDKPPETPKVRANKYRIRVRGGIRYAGTDVNDRSHEELDQLATFLKYHPEYAVIRIGVHTDDRGNPRARSQARAEAVRSYLIDKGVAPDRVVAKGYGASQPIAVNLTAAGRRKNNRTEIRVTDYDEAKARSGGK